MRALETKEPNEWPTWTILDGVPSVPLYCPDLRSMVTYCRMVSWIVAGEPSNPETLIEVLVNLEICGCGLGVD